MISPNALPTNLLFITIYGEGGQSALRLRVGSEEDDRRAALEALIETCCHEGDADGALEVFDVVKSFDIPVGKVTLAFLENFCRRSRVPEWRVFDVCAQMRARRAGGKCAIVCPIRKGPKNDVISWANEDETAQQKTYLLATAEGGPDAKVD